LRGKLAAMLRPDDAERITGYCVGGISPFGQRKQVSSVIEASALEHGAVFIDGGQRGVQVRLDPKDAHAILKAHAAAVVVEG
jgi:Cys-tRNA(Pro)/Cys-tRNA(Cys) deacylase